MRGLALPAQCRLSIIGFLSARQDFILNHNVALAAHAEEIATRAVLSICFIVDAHNIVLHFFALLYSVLKLERLSDELMLACVAHFAEALVRRLA